MRIWAAVPFVVLAMLGSAFVAVNTPVVEGSDASDYCLSARYNPVRDYFDSPSHGWGYPALIKLVAAATGDEFIAAKAISVLASGVFMFWAALLCFRTLPVIHAAPAAAVIALHPMVLHAGGNALCEMLFAALFFTALFLCFICRPSVIACAMAGVLIVMATMVRGNGIVVLPLIPLLLLLRMEDRQWKHAGAFLGGAIGLLAIEAGIFAALGVSSSLWMRSGAGELAFAALEPGGNFKNHFYWTDSHITYASLFVHHGRQVGWRAIQALRNINEWWFTPSFDALSYFIIPGILIWFSKARRGDQAIGLSSLAVLGTFLWSMHFSEHRHLLQTAPLLILGIFACLTVLPKRLDLIPRFHLPRVPVRTPVIWAVAFVLLCFSVSFLWGTAKRGRHSPYEDRLFSAGNGSPPCRTLPPIAWQRRA